MPHRRHGKAVFDVTFQTRGKLYAAWIPIFKFGGLFVSTKLQLQLGDTSLLVVTLPDDPGATPIEGTVAWINPPHTSRSRPEGVGVALPGTDAATRLRLRIEAILGASLASQHPTFTI